MFSIPEPFLSSEIAYRNERAMRAYDRHPSRRRRHDTRPARRYWVPRRPTLSLPGRRRGPAAVA
jgi:hypothetical protein